MKQLFRYPKEIYILWLISFIVGLDLIGAFIIPFLRGWGGLSQFQTQLLQSWFTMLVFFLEIPTGLVGDIKGRKYSVLAGFLFLTIAPIIYGSIPDFRIFLCAEFFYALSMAFLSGAQEALLYDTVAEKNLVKHYGIINIIDDNLKLVGMMSAAVIGGFLLTFMSVNRLFQFQAVFHFIAFIMLFLFIKEPTLSRVKEFIPDYKEIFRRARHSVLENPVLKRLVLFAVSVSLVSYFVIWFYQVILQQLAINENSYGYFRILFLSAEVVLSFVITRIVMKTKKRSIWILSSILLVAFGFLAVIILKNVLGIIFFLVFSGGIGQKFRNILSPFINEHIESSERATTLSFISMFRRLGLTVFNPIFGFLADVEIKLSLSVLLIFLLFVIVFFIPKKEHLHLSS